MSILWFIIIIINHEKCESCLLEKKLNESLNIYFFFISVEMILEDILFGEKLFLYG